MLARATATAGSSGHSKDFIGHLLPGTVIRSSHSLGETKSKWTNKSTIECPVVVRLMMPAKAGRGARVTGLVALSP